MTFQTIYLNDMKQFLRNRWLVWFGVLFTLVATSFLIFGGANQEAYDGFHANLASLLNVNLFLLPLVLFIMGAVSFSAEKEEGLLSLILTYPISYRGFVWAKMLSLTTAMLLILCFSYGIASIGGFVWGTSLSLDTMLIFFILSIVLIVLLAPLSILTGVLSKSKFHAMAIALGLWAVLVLLYEFIFMGAITFVSPAAMTPVLTLSVAINPVELVRVAAIIMIDEGVSLGPSLYDFTAFISNGAGAYLFLISMIMWILAPMAISYWMMRGGKVHGE
ncbi:ABC transporter permease subunit [Salimicrobium sp. PL1-032A]|uniref:ABC transporter permease n=1 Tax=Salimicrobium sp. PL1-032A TaxID=3095364 RepID=UPI00326039BD